MGCHESGKHKLSKPCENAGTDVEHAPMRGGRSFVHVRKTRAVNL